MILWVPESHVQAYVFKKLEQSDKNNSSFIYLFIFYYSVYQTLDNVNWF